jgi:hypothetical protein
MNAFWRGNRDQVQRSQDGSLVQQLYLMNDAFVTNRVKVGSSPRLRAVAQMSDNQQVLEELYMTFLSRRPSDYEKSRALDFLSKATTAAARNLAVEDLAWVLINKVEFLFSY